MWSEAEDALLRQQWPIASASMISTMIPRSRNAIIGRARRMGLDASEPVEAKQPGHWTEAELLILRRNWANKRTPAEIAKALAQAGFQRSQRNVSDKANKLGLPARPRAKTVHHIPKPKAARIMQKPEPIAPLNIPFLDVRSGECRAITDSTRDAQRWCGHPVDERGTYCSQHRAIFYTRSQGKSA